MKVPLFLASCLIGLGMLVLPSKIAAQSTQPSFSFDPPIAAANPDALITSQVIIDTAGQSIKGAGAKINYDPTVLRVVNITKGTIFADYPLAAFDNSTGKMTISGVVTNPTDSFVGRATFATITWKPLKNQATEVTFQYQPGSTRDSNLAVTYGNGDILTQVTSLNIVPFTGSIPGTISPTLPGTAGGSGTPSFSNPVPATATNPSFVELTSTWILNQLKEFSFSTNRLISQIRYGVSDELPTSVDPYDPNLSLPTNPTLQTQQPAAQNVTISNAGGQSSVSSGRGTNLFLLGTLFAAFLLLMILIIVVLKRRKRKSDVQTQP